MNAAPDDGFSFDPKTWAVPPELVAVARPAPGGRGMLAAILSILLLLGGAGAAYLTRAPAATAPAAASLR